MEGAVLGSCPGAVYICLYIYIFMEWCSMISVFMPGSVFVRGRIEVQ